MRSWVFLQCFWKSSKSILCLSQAPKCLSSNVLQRDQLSAWQANLTCLPYNMFACFGKGFCLTLLSCFIFVLGKHYERVGLSIDRKMKRLRHSIVTLVIHLSWHMCNIAVNRMFLDYFALCKYKLLTLHKLCKCKLQFSLLNVQCKWNRKLWDYRSS